MLQHVVEGPVVKELDELGIGHLQRRLDVREQRLVIALRLLADGHDLPLSPGAGREVRRIAGALNLDARERVADRPQVVRGQLDRGGADVLPDAVHLGGARDGHDPRPLREQPCQGDLSGRDLLAAAMAPIRSTSAWLALRASGEKRGTMLRKSSLANVVLSSILPVRKPLPRGLNGTKPIPSSSHVGRTQTGVLHRLFKFLFDAFRMGRHAAGRQAATNDGFLAAGPLLRGNRIEFINDHLTSILSIGRPRFGFAVA